MVHIGEQMVFYGIFRPFRLIRVGIRHLVRANRIKAKMVDLPGLGALWVNDSLNFVGENCLRTNLLTKLILEKAAAGNVFEISSDNLSAVETIPFMLPNCNCELLATVHETACLKIYVRKLTNKAPFGDTGTESPGRWK